MQLSVGSKMGPYEILGSLGAGGMGQVYRAHDRRLNRNVAIKVVADHLANEAGALARFKAEARAVAALTHPNILAIHDIGTEQGVSYAVMELLDGETLRQAMQRGPLYWKKAVEIGSAIAEGLSAAHAKGIIHRDLKPENLFLTADGRVKILDFGLARIEGTSHSDDETRSFSPGQTQPGTILGTVGYMSPEQIKGESVDARSDIFSLGCVLYEMTAGNQPFRRKTAAETHAAILYEDPPELTSLQKDLPSELDRHVRHCLEKNREKRFQSARDLAFDLDALIVRSSGTERQPSLRPTQPGLRTLTGALLVAIFFAVGIVILWKKIHEAPPPATIASDETVDSIAVLPFINAGKDPEAEYLSDGFSAGIRKSLADVRRLKVRPESAVSKFRGSDLDLQEIGKKLQVQTILTGTVRPRAGIFEVTVELIDTRQNNLLWQENYHRSRQQLQDTQEEVALRVCDKLQLQLTPEDRQSLAKRYTGNAEAHDLYLKGRFAWNKRTKEGIQTGISFFQQAIDKDPNYALPFVGLADSYCTLENYDWMTPQEAFPRAKAAARKALNLDPGLAEAYTTLAALSFDFDWDIKQAENFFQRALELNPQNAKTHFWYGKFLVQCGQFQSGITSIRYALKLDPTSLSISTAVGVAHYCARRYDEAVYHLKHTLEVQRDYVPALQYLGLTYFQQGLHKQAIDVLKEAALQSKRDPAVLERLGCILAKTGCQTEAQKILEELEDAAKRTYVPDVDLAVLLASLGKLDLAFDHLNDAYKKREGSLVQMKVDPLYDELRPDPRFQNILSRMGLAAESPTSK
ncbi:MAG: protein kinase domain-containing protein [Gemmataceae bacterium]